MARSRNPVRPRLGRDAERLIALSLALDGSGSRVEDRFWERELESLVTKQLQSEQDGALDQALDHLLPKHPGGYEMLIEIAETLSESIVLERDGERYDALLIVAPVAAWTRYTIPVGPIRSDALDALRAQLHGHILASDVSLALAPTLYSIDQMPRNFGTTRQWLKQLGSEALGLPSGALRAGNEEVANLLADTRYVVGAIVVKEGGALFRWQEGMGREATRETCLAAWVAQAEPTFTSLLPGCGVEVLLPDAYYVSNREADRRVRPLSVRAAVAWLAGALTLEPSQIRAVIAGCGESQVEEFRIGFTARNRNEVVYGTVWPVYGREDDAAPDADPQDEIVELLNSLGVSDVRRIGELLPLEFCDDCGAPFFPDPTGELVHAEMPHEADTAPTHFH